MTGGSDDDLIEDGRVHGGESSGNMTQTQNSASEDLPSSGEPLHDDRSHILHETSICSGKVSILAQYHDDKTQQDVSNQATDDIVSGQLLQDGKTEGKTELRAENSIAVVAATSNEPKPGVRSLAEDREPDPIVVDKKDLIELEATVRKNVQHGVLYNFISSSIASILVFALHLIRFECLVSVALGVGFTVYTYNATANNHYFNGSALNWTLLSFAVITPMSASLRMSFRRREDALRCFAELRATFLEMYLAHLCWDWRKAGPNASGRAASSVNWLEHSDGVLSNILDISDLLTRYLTLPNANRSRHRIFPPCRRDAKQILDLSAKFHDAITLHMCYISEYCEILKQEGLPPNEASRIRQWERFIVEYVEQLRMIKHYRTPQALRSFARLFSVLLPPLYAPYFADLARQVESLGFAISFTIITSLALTGLFETIYQMEDPFETVASLDGVRVEEEFCEIYRKRFLIMRAQYFKTAPPFSWKAIKDNEIASPIQNN